MFYQYYAVLSNQLIVSKISICVYNMCLYCVYLHINIHTYMYIFKKYMLFIYKINQMYKLYI